LLHLVGLISLLYRQGKVCAQLGPLEEASLIPLDTCLKEVIADE